MPTDQVHWASNHWALDHWHVDHWAKFTAPVIGAGGSRMLLLGVGRSFLPFFLAMKALFI